MTPPDRRIAAYRPDLADRRLEGIVEAGRFVDGRPMRVAVPNVGLRQEPRPDSEWGSELVLGDDVAVFEEAESWCWVQSLRDDYVGYLPDTALNVPDAEPTHVVAVPRTFAYPGPELRAPATSTLSMGSRLVVTGEAERRGTRYLILDSGEALIARHLCPSGQPVDDYVTVAEALIHTPYLWGGTSGFGLDCSGLVQLSMRMAGRFVPRDTDMQASVIGELLGLDPLGHRLRRGDLVFWKGHVGIMVDAGTLIHANGLSMTVAIEPLDRAVSRIASIYGMPTAIRRP